MIAFVEGTVVDIEVDAIVVETNGVGYFIYCANPYSFQQHQGQKTKVYTYQYVREDMIALYGFHSKQEKTLFTHLLAVSGIGPKGALAILAASRPEEVATAVENEDERYLRQFPGVGKKTARQMILDLKGKLEVPALTATVASEPHAHRVNKELLDAEAALKSLGYAEKEIRKVVKQLSGEDLTTDEYVKKALQYMVKQ